ncbi:hypothetical protein BGZ57DRAFT_896154 [Hyaloscypha finlandica]|nr:hypothetical protein BGZ57DRAFT_896154 [Hyaloscypha finlandica]
MKISEIALLILGFIPPIGQRISAIYDLQDHSIEFNHSEVPHLLHRLRNEYGSTCALLLLWLFPAELKVMERIERHILPAESTSQVMELKSSLSSDCGMFAVAVCLSN